MLKDRHDDIFQGLVANQVSGREYEGILREERGDLVGQILAVLH